MSFRAMSAEVPGTAVQAPETSPATEPAAANAPAVEAASPHRPRLGAAGAAMIAWCTIGVVNAVAIVTTVPLPAGGASLRIAHHLYDAGHMIAMGLACAGIVALWQRWGPQRPAWGYAALAAASIAAGFALLPDDLFSFSQQQGEAGIPPEILQPIATVMVAAGVPAAALLGRLLSRRALLRIAGAVLALAAAALNHGILVNDYPGAHFYLAAAAAALGASSIAGAPMTLRRAHSKRTIEAIDPAAPRAEPRWKAAAPWAVPAFLALWGGLAVALPPKSAVIVELFKASGSVVAPILARAASRPSAKDASIPAEARPWFADRSGAPPVPPSEPRLLPPNGIVILISIDAARAEVLAGDRHAAILRALTALKRVAVEFTTARSPGSQTVYSLSTLFMGTYFSQQYWTPLHEPHRSNLWPHEDTSPRFPELLSAAGVPSLNIGAATWMTSTYGVARGFSEDRVIATGTKYAGANDMMAAAINYLKKHGPGPLFLFMHFLDPHAPYDRAGTEGAPFDRYLGEIELVDREIQGLRSALSLAGLAPRTALIVTADHGEAFGEHGTKNHATTLYEEQLRIPLLIALPGVAPRRVETPVSLVDLGPTVLDLMGLPTPGHFMGQSLVPFLRGEAPELTRPIVAEGRLKRSMVFPDEIKAIIDGRNGTVEVYNLKDDPGETRNLFDEGGDAQGHAAVLQAFIEAHTRKQRGYRVPYRR